MTSFAARIRRLVYGRRGESPVPDVLGKFGNLTYSSNLPESPKPFDEQGEPPTLDPETLPWELRN